MFKENAWEAYKSLNERFADEIVANYRENDISKISAWPILACWLTLARFLGLKFGSMIITWCFFLACYGNDSRVRLSDSSSIYHSLALSFSAACPVSDISRFVFGMAYINTNIFLARKQLLEGILGADLVGFQTYSFARHFLQTCSRILSVDATPTGIQLDSHYVSVRIYPIGIDITTLNKKRSAQPRWCRWWTKDEWNSQILYLDPHLKYYDQLTCLKKSMLEKSLLLLETSWITSKAYGKRCSLLSSFSFATLNGVERLEKEAVHIYRNTKSRTPTTTIIVAIVTKGCTHPNCVIYGRGQRASRAYIRRCGSRQLEI